MAKRRAGRVDAETGWWLVLTESKQDNETGEWHHKCGAVVQGKRVIHPVWDGPVPCSGGGEVRSQVVPFCPECEAAISNIGWPVGASM